MTQLSRRWCILPLACLRAVILFVFLAVVLGQVGCHVPTGLWYIAVTGAVVAAVCREEDSRT